MMSRVMDGALVDSSLRLIKVLDEFEKLWDAMPISVAKLFLTVAAAAEAKRHLGITEAGEAVGMKLASASRNIQLLENRMVYRGGEPLDLIEVKAHPSDYRRKVIYLTPKGRNFYNRIVTLVRLAASEENSK